MYLDSLGLMQALRGVPSSNDGSKVIFLQNDKQTKQRLVAMLHSCCFCHVSDNKEMWENLEAIFAKNSMISQVLKCKELYKLKMNDTALTATFLLKFENLTEILMKTMS